MRQLSQPFLQLQGILQQPRIMFPAFLQGAFHAPAPDDASLQLTVGGGQFGRAAIERFGQPAQLRLALLRGTMRFHDWSDHLGKKNLRLLDVPIFGCGQLQRDKCLLVHPGQFQRLQSKSDRLTAQSQRGLRVRGPACLQVVPQRRPISSGQEHQFRFHLCNAVHR